MVKFPPWFKSENIWKRYLTLFWCSKTSKRKLKFLNTSAKGFHEWCYGLRGREYCRGFRALLLKSWQWGKSKIINNCMTSLYKWPFMVCVFISLDYWLIGGRPYMTSRYKVSRLRFFLRKHKGLFVKSVRMGCKKISKLTWQNLWTTPNDFLTKRFQVIRTSARVLGFSKHRPRHNGRSWRLWFVVGSILQNIYKSKIEIFSM